MNSRSVLKFGGSSLYEDNIESVSIIDINRMGRSILNITSVFLLSIVLLLIFSRSTIISEHINIIFEEIFKYIPFIGARFNYLRNNNLEIGFFLFFIIFVAWTTYNSYLESKSFKVVLQMKSGAKVFSNKSNIKVARGTKRIIENFMEDGVIDTNRDGHIGYYVEQSSFISSIFYGIFFTALTMALYGLLLKIEIGSAFVYFIPMLGVFVFGRFWDDIAPLHQLKVSIFRNGWISEIVLKDGKRDEMFDEQNKCFDQLKSEVSDRHSSNDSNLVQSV